MCTVTYYNGRMRGRGAREEYTIRGVHVGGSTGVQDPGVGALDRHLLQGGDQPSLIP